MNSSFDKIKNKYLIKAIVKSAIAGVSSGLFAVGAVLLALKLSLIEINIGFYFLIGIVIAAAVGGVMFLVLRPDDKKVAKQLDEEYALKEKVQTMVAFRDAQGDIFELQRHDADEKLNALPARKPDIKKFWQYILMGVLALAMAVTAIALPYYGKSEEATAGIELTARERELVVQLIDDVNGSRLDDGVKTGVSAVFNSLLNKLEGAHTVEDRRSAVVSAVILNDAIIAESNGYKRLCTELVKREGLKALSNAVVEGVTVFLNGSSLYTGYDKVKERADTLYDDVYAVIEKEFVSGENSIRKSFVNTGDKSLSETLSAYCDDLDKAVTGSATDASGVMYDAADGYLSMLTGALEKCKQNYADSTVQNELDAGFTSSVQSFAAAVNKEAYNCLMNEFMRNRIALIFSVPFDMLPVLTYRVGSDGTDDNGDKPDSGENKPSPGAPGKGDLIMGSDDIIYDKDTGHVSYGTVITDYYEKVLQFIIENDLPEELVASLNDYYSMLMNGIETPEENN